MLDLGEGGEGNLCEATPEIIAELFHESVPSPHWTKPTSGLPELPTTASRDWRPARRLSCSRNRVAPARCGTRNYRADSTESAGPRRAWWGSVPASSSLRSQPVPGFGLADGVAESAKAWRWR